MKNRNKERRFLYFGSILFLLILLNSLVFFFRVDLSLNQAYSISPLSKKVMEQMQAPVQINYYISEKLKNQKSEISSIIDILEEYRQNSNGKILLKLIDPIGKDTQQHIQNLGVQAQELPIVENNRVINTLVYSGITIQYLNSSTVLPIVSSPESIEYNITAALQGFLHKKNRVLGILSGGSGQDLDSQFTMLGQVFDKDVEVRFLKAGEVIPGNIDALFVLRDQGLGMLDAFYIDQFIMSGKGVLIGNETVGVGLTDTWVAVPHASGILSMLVDKYGITTTKGWVLDDSNFNFPAKASAGDDEENLELPYPAWIQSIGQNLNMDNPVSARSVGLDLLWSSPLSVKPGSNGQILVSSTRSSWVMKTNMVADSEQLGRVHYVEQQNHKQEHRSFGLAVAIEGQIESYFSNQDLQKVFPKIQLPPIIKTSSNSKLMVIGSASFASDLYQVLIQNGLIAQPKNIIFLQNSFDWLTGNSDLLKLRTRILKDEHLDKIENPEQKDKLGTLVFIFNALIIPIIIIVFGIIHFWRRKNLSSGDHNAN